MTETSVLEFLNQYGLLFVFTIVFMEYLNLPGFPSGVIMPACGVWITITHNSFITCFIVTIIAGVMGSLILYFIGLYGGDPIINKLCNRYPKFKSNMDKLIIKLHNGANYTVFISKLVPVVRTLVGFPAGAIKMNLFNYILFSSFGIAIWNGVLILTGMLASGLFIK